MKNLAGQLTTAADRSRPKQLANKLKEYGIHSKNLAFGLSDRPKGYMRSWFADAFERYIASAVPPSSATAATTSRDAGFKVAEEISVAATQALSAT